MLRGSDGVETGLDVVIKTVEFDDKGVDEHSEIKILLA